LALSLNSGTTTDISGTASSMTAVETDFSFRR
jgi:hypothetical protein